MTGEVEVLVVGGGLAGCTAARQLHDTGHDVVLWEARDRLGGRTLTTRFDGAALDLGAQWIGPAQHRMQSLARSFGRPTFPTHAAGDALVVEGTDRHRYGGTVPLLGPVQLARMGAALARLQWLAARSGRGRAVTSQSLAATMGGALGDGAARAVVDAALLVIFGEQPDAVSTDWAAAYAAASGGTLLDLAAIEGGAQETRLVGGTQELSAALADGLDVALGRGLARLERRADRVRATSLDGTHVVARRVVLAMPPALVDEVEHVPPLPSGRRRVTASMAMGATAKVFALYDEPFWREDGLRGEAVLTAGPVQIAFDATSHDGSVPALLGFVTGDAARTLGDAQDDVTREAVLASLARAFGPRAAAPIDVVQHHWVREAWTRGCPTENVRPGGPQAAARTLARPIGPLHFAGTETADEWRGFMEGAVQSGERAAAAVARSLG